MSRKRRSKTLEKAARAVKDSDDFVEHVFNIARGFADHHALDSGAGTRGVRASLRAFAKNATALVQWFDRASERGSPEHEGLDAIRDALAKSTAGRVDLDSTRAWLERAALASEAADEQLQGKKLRQAPSFAARAVRATFEHHKLKLSVQASPKKQSDAVKLLCAIAKDGGDASMTPAQARDWLAQSAGK
jgi:hypothetical protein